MMVMVSLIDYYFSQKVGKRDIILQFTIFFLKINGTQFHFLTFEQIISLNENFALFFISNLFSNDG
jgi:hypothetical protein